MKMSSGKWRPFCLGLNVLNAYCTLIFLTVPFSTYSTHWPLLAWSFTSISAHYQLAQTASLSSWLPEPTGYTAACLVYCLVAEFQYSTHQSHILLQWTNITCLFIRLAHTVVGITKPIFSILLFRPRFKITQTNTLMEYHIYIIWQMLPKHSFVDTWKQRDSKDLHRNSQTSKLWLTKTLTRGSSYPKPRLGLIYDFQYTKTHNF